MKLRKEQCTSWIFFLRPLDSIGNFQSMKNILINNKMNFFFSFEINPSWTVIFLFVIALRIRKWLTLYLPPYIRKPRAAIQDITAHRFKSQKWNKQLPQKSQAICKMVLDLCMLFNTKAIEALHWFKITWHENFTDRCYSLAVFYWKVYPYAYLFQYFQLYL